MIKSDFEKLLLTIRAIDLELATVLLTLSAKCRKHKAFHNERELLVLDGVLSRIMCSGPENFVR